MDFASFGGTCTIAEPFDAGLKRVRRVFRAAGLSISGEDDVCGRRRDSGMATTRCRVLYLDSPLLLFEALALDRGAAVFLPLHVLVRPEGRQTRVHWINPAAVFGTRLPAGAAIPIYDLQVRLAGALATLNGAEG